MVDNGLSAYEQARQARILENKAKLAMVMRAAAVFREACETQPKPVRRAATKKRRRELVEVEVRRSLRAHALPPNFSYREDCKTALRSSGDGGRPRVAGARMPKASRCWSRAEVGWHPRNGQAGEGAVAAAVAAAEERMERVVEEGGWGYAKVMTPSMVSGGFWCSGDNALAPHLGCSSRLQKDIEFLAGTGRLPAWEEGKSWSVMWHPHGKASWGWSGGWRGFAIDQDLYPGDAVVYQVEDPSTIRVHIFRRDPLLLDKSLSMRLTNA